MMTEDMDSSRTILFLSQDKRLAQTRAWVLEQAGFNLRTVQTLADLYIVAALLQTTAFLLCNSLSAELLTEAVTHIRNRRSVAKILIFVPSYSLPELPVDEFFSSTEGPKHLIQKVQRLMSAAQIPLN